MSGENPVEIPATMPGRNGGTLKRGGTNPGAGRPPNEYRQHLRDILDDPKVADALTKILSDADHPQFASLYGKVVAQAHGNPTQPIELDSAVLPTFRVECE